MRNKIASVIGFINGLWVLYIGVMHFPMAFETSALPAFAVLKNDASEFFILMTMCVGILLIFTGLLTMFFSIRVRSGDRVARIFFGLAAVLFFARTYLEWLYPVRIPEPAPEVFVTLLLTAIVFAVTALLSSVKR